jgi:ferredoxin
MRIELTLATCQGYANCVVEAPELFDLDEVTNKAVIIVDTVPAELEADARQAEANCPVRAITLHD